jgi:hypothetical protein
MAFVIGNGATPAMDLRTFARGRLFGTPLTNCGLVGRRRGFARWLERMVLGAHTRRAVVSAARREHAAR